MSENELNSYRFLSGEDPSDEMLYAIMEEARNEAMRKAKEAQKIFDADYERQYRKAYDKWHKRINQARNGAV